MKPKELIKFVMKNAREIRKYDNKLAGYKKSPTLDNKMMCSHLTCVLRPWSLPIEIANKMSVKELNEYTNQATEFSSIDEIDDAIKWVKGWMSK